MLTTLPEPTTDDLDFLEARGVTATSIRKRVVIERAIVRHACDELLNAGYILRLHDGEAWATPYTADTDEIMQELQACDCETLYAYSPVEDQRPLVGGSIFLVYGNDGWDVINDNSVALEMHLTGTFALVNALADLSFTTN